MDSKDILAVHSTLHLIFHRNKNQHHRTKWWKWLSILKRATLDLTGPNAVECQKHLATYIIPRCYMYGMMPEISSLANPMSRAFSTVVADNQFSTLGIVLLAALARLSKITGTSHQMKMQPARKSKTATPVVTKEDIGECVRRADAPRPVKVSNPNASVSEKPERDGAGKSVKRKKKKNAIDDLFSGLF
ncbi:hypothetical protein N7457_006752 [Penicillium paradoxum]|uniref:uncharacterized protein n=1 Tax=Penicillium paradoxum TaxID=176176 RepID=UPI002548A549|nr:uncharacterized protein N7457_006752 [Penicillium paradoxum]KAJ5779032.1 hypothetical protein N7457_006752 [Penicillium paradoxum]